MKEGIAGEAIYRKDYEAYAWNVAKLDLHFDIGTETTVVSASMNFQLKNDEDGPQDIVLNGSDLELISISLNGRDLKDDDYMIEGETLTIPNAPQSSKLETEVRIHPATNFAFEGSMFQETFCSRNVKHRVSEKSPGFQIDQM